VSDNADLKLSTYGILPVGIMMLHLEYGHWKIYENITRAIYKKKLSIIEYSNTVKNVTRKFEGIRILEHIFDNHLEFHFPQSNTLYIIDVDGMSRINRVFGMDIGDLVVELIREVLIRAADLGGGIAEQCGDDAFFLFLPLDVADKLMCQAIEELTNFGWRSIAIGLWVTVSVGAAVRVGNSAELGIDLAMRAILGMREAKRLGGNRIENGPLALPHSGIGSRARAYGSFS
jgi:GGDEF domain-containing protein